MTLIVCMKDIFNKLCVLERNSIFDVLNWISVNWLILSIHHIKEPCDVSIFIYLDCDTFA